LIAAPNEPPMIACGVKAYLKIMPTVAGINFAIYADITKRGMIAVNEATGEEKIIIRSGYATKDLTIRKAVANAFSLPSFRSK